MDDTYIITAGRMARGDAVGEAFLYGRESCELIRRRLVDEPTMTRYRSAAFFRRRDIHGEEAALEWERQAKATHEHSKAMTRDAVPTRRNVTLPTMTAPRAYSEIDG